MSRSCQSAMFSRPTMLFARTIRAMPQMRSEMIGLRLCGIALEPFWPLVKRSCASRTSVRCQWRTFNANFASSLEKFALNVRHWQRTEVREAQERFTKGQKGSSAMPHKRNPIISERICGMARIVRANSIVGLENIALWHERDISHSSAERVVLPDSSIALDYMLQKAKSLIDGLVVHPIACWRT